MEKISADQHREKTSGAKIRAKNMIPQAIRRAERSKIGQILAFLGSFLLPPEAFAKNESIECSLGAAIHTSFEETPAISGGCMVQDFTDQPVTGFFGFEAMASHTDIPTQSGGLARGDMVNMSGVAAIRNRFHPDFAFEVRTAIGGLLLVSSSQTVNGKNGPSKVSASNGLGLSARVEARGILDLGGNFALYAGLNGGATVLNYNTIGTDQKGPVVVPLSHISTGVSYRF